MVPCSVQRCPGRKSFPCGCFLTAAVATLPDVYRQDGTLRCRERPTASHVAGSCQGLRCQIHFNMAHMLEFPQLRVPHVSGHFPFISTWPARESFSRGMGPCVAPKCFGPALLLLLVHPLKCSSFPTCANCFPHAPFACDKSFQGTLFDQGCCCYPFSSTVLSWLVFEGFQPLSLAERTLECRGRALIWSWNSLDSLGSAAVFQPGLPQRVVARMEVEGESP